MKKKYTVSSVSRDHFPVLHGHDPSKVMELSEEDRKEVEKFKKYLENQMRPTEKKKYEGYTYDELVQWIENLQGKIKEGKEEYDLYCQSISGLVAHKQRRIDFLLKELGRENCLHREISYSRRESWCVRCGKLFDSSIIERQQITIPKGEFNEIQSDGKTSETTSCERDQCIEATRQNQNKDI